MLNLLQKSKEKKRNIIFFSSLVKCKDSRFILKILVILLTFFILWPLFSLISEGLYGIQKGSVYLTKDNFNEIKGTLLLLVFSLTLGGFLGITNGWILANCNFKGRKILRIFQLIPFATPAYLLAATFIDLGSINSIRITGMFWGVVIMAFTTYPYVFLLSSESFEKGGRKQIEACRTLGIGPWKSFFKISLPIAIPSITAGLALMAMEIINELGAVQLLNIPSISAGIIESWIEEGEPSGAIALALFTLILVFILISIERKSRERSKRWTDGIIGGDSPKWKLKGINLFLAQVITFTPPILTLGIPITWAITNIDQMNQGFNTELIGLTVRSFSLGLIVALITIFISLILSISKRWQNHKWLNLLTFLSSIGYAIPGSVLALAIISFNGNIWQINILSLLIWGYSIRFLAVSKGGLDAGFEGISPNIDNAAINLGKSWPEVLIKIHLPLLRGPMIVGALLVFVDTIKELPLTFILRPFDFDTLSVRIFQYAGDERVAESIFPSLIIICLGLIASLALIPSLNNRNN
ncbi:ABC transporter permease [Prochlorococcus marinus]|uniref:Iron ABC transporter n=1 Tax=Prochlorococcus marinus XMU1408 TaxID=2213228 RepID=A0A318R343_PROMR|nr:iron ABC transporter permease [Prochlorococcus marinus]MBW3041516.1 iron ABC transporter [Prochlorococcus marinus str. XMU1408]PYE02674.1 iron ABC transporter [Prochlorococcus marinus XMU1408]